MINTDSDNDLGSSFHPGNCEIILTNPNFCAAQIIGGRFYTSATVGQNQQLVLSNGTCGMIVYGGSDP